MQALHGMARSTRWFLLALTAAVAGRTAGRARLVARARAAHGPPRRRRRARAVVRGDGRAACRDADRGAARGKPTPLGAPPGPAAARARPASPQPPRCASGRLRTLGDSWSTRVTRFARGGRRVATGGPYRLHPPSQLPRGHPRARGAAAGRRRHGSPQSRASALDALVLAQPHPARGARARRAIRRGARRCCGRARACRGREVRVGGMSARVDVVIAGAGPAGCATALACARRGLEVLLLDRARFPRDKACGEGLLPSGDRRALAELGLLDRGAPHGAARSTGVSLRRRRRTTRPSPRRLPRRAVPAYGLGVQPPRLRRAPRRRRARAADRDGADGVGANGPLRREDGMRHRPGHRRRSHRRARGRRRRRAALAPARRARPRSRPRRHGDERRGTHRAARAPARRRAAVRPRASTSSSAARSNTTSRRSRRASCSWRCSARAPPSRTARSLPPASRDTCARIRASARASPAPSCSIVRSAPARSASASRPSSPAVRCSSVTPPATSTPSPAKASARRCARASPPAPPSPPPSPSPASGREHRCRPARSRPMPRAHAAIVRDGDRLTELVLLLARHPWLARRAIAVAGAPTGGAAAPVAACMPARRCRRCRCAIGRCWSPAEPPLRSGHEQLAADHELVGERRLRRRASASGRRAAMIGRSLLLRAQPSTSASSARVADADPMTPISRAIR